MDSQTISKIDVVVCIGPNDTHIVENCIDTINKNIIDLDIIYIITHTTLQPSNYSNVVFIDEKIFPFTIETIHSIFKTPHRSGWYLQQLLKLYACKCIPQLKDNFIIIDSDVIFHRPISFFKDDKILFNVGKEHHLPYFEHMKKMHPSLHRVMNYSGVCHLMPMKRQIINDFMSMIETYHKQDFWKVFLSYVAPEDYAWSGASEFELLFNYTLLYHQDKYEIRPLQWKNSSKYTPNYEGYYEACHYYMR